MTKVYSRKDQLLFTALKEEYNDNLYHCIKQSIEAKEDIEDLKRFIISSSRVSKGMVTRAERRINAEAAEIEHLIARKKKERTGFER
ncbi:uncharacterized protein EV154DRAFT_108244 [Mucor mucedo]|uniref:uncharacterized protein n=1 Tax=Mucor mucedo TaxID=29922 RepID=UPI002220D363|nr:uncharacterized protein EV154DRAFT_108244 [Mucor mucedo]KAI7894159.1 hypothetical protein EV154DRAFT_108244 [Mucor mucedo]